MAGGNTPTYTHPQSQLLGSLVKDPYCIPVEFVKFLLPSHAFQMDSLVVKVMIWELFLLGNCSDLR